MKRAFFIGLACVPIVALCVLEACSSDSGGLQVDPRTKNPVPVDATDEDVAIDAPVDAPDDVTDAGTDAPVEAASGTFGLATGAGPMPTLGIGYGDHTCAIAGTDHSVYCWGANEHGQAGNGEPLDAGSAADAATVDGGLYDGGTSPADVGVAQKIAVDEQGLALSGIDDVAAAAWHTCARRANDLYCWGQRYSGAQAEPPFASNPDRSRPRYIGKVPIARVATGGMHTCVLQATGKLACFGHSALGELGRPSIGDPSCGGPLFYDYPSLPTGTHTCNGAIGEMSTAISGIQGLAAGELHTCAITLQHVKCWGGNDSGELGVTGNAASSAVPVDVYTDAANTVALDGVTALSAGGGRHTCAISANKAYCWGANASGQLGVDPAVTPLRANAAAVAGLPLVNGIGAGDGVSCAITPDGFVWCWGADESGQLGDGVPKVSSFTPVQVKGPGNIGVLSNVKAIAPGRRHVCAVLADSTVFCWGKNDRGQLGDGTFVDSLYPVKVKGLP
jgi:alpha-tubulin suppressor-like RCC1 family protein